MLASLFSLPITPAQVPHWLGLNRGWGTMNTTLSTAYNYKVVRQFTIMTVVWGIVGMGLGVFLAAQLVWPALNFDLPWTSFGRLRPKLVQGKSKLSAGQTNWAARKTPSPMPTMPHTTVIMVNWRTTL